MICFYVSDGWTMFTVGRCFIRNYLIAHARYHQFNHAHQNQTQVAPLLSKQSSSSPCGQNAPQGSPASPASTRCLPTTATATTTTTTTVVTQRPSVITEQKPVANCHNVVNISTTSQSDCLNQNAQLGTNPPADNSSSTTTTTELRQHRRSVRGML